MAVRFPVAVRNSRADVITTRAGSGAIIRIYTGTQPANADTAASGTLLAELTCSSPFAPAAASGVLTASAITQDASANATGTAGYFRVFQSNGTTVVMDGSVTATGGGGDMTLNSTSVTSGQPVSITSFALTEGNA